MNLKIPIIVAFPIALLTLSLALAADENKDVPNLAQSASQKGVGSWYWHILGPCSFNPVL
jgi:hypothetical protein